MDSNELIPLRLPEQQKSIIKVIGVGGGGSNAVNHMCRQGIHGVEFVVCNTDIQALRYSPVKNRVQLGKELTEGRGAGCIPERGKQSALETLDFIKIMLSDNTKMIFITAGMGGGTGTGAAPEIAKVAREMGILTIGIVTVPFSFEGRKKILQAIHGIDELEKNVDALIIIQNDRLKDIYGDLKLSDAFAMADNVLTIAAKSIAEIITYKGYVNVDLADVDGVMRNSGVALMGASEADGEDRALEALKGALTSPLLSSHDISGASDILVNMLYGNKEVTMDEISLIINQLQERIGGNVNVIWGTGSDIELGDKLRVAIIAVGFNKNNPMNYDPAASVTVEAKKETPFKLEESPEELEMVAVDSRELEEKARQQRAKQGGMKKASRKKDTDLDGGVNDIPDTNSWFFGKFGGIFDETASRDKEMK